MEILNTTMPALGLAPVQALALDDALKSGELENHKGRYSFAPTSDIGKQMMPEPIKKMGSPLSFAPLLRYAAAAYKISKDPRDYLVVPVPIVLSETPNRNGVGFPVKELVKFDTEYGMPAYQTWTGKPTHIDHVNEDVTKAKGIIFDTAMLPIEGYPDFWKVVTLLGFDRRKDEDLYHQILSGIRNGYSMGAMVRQYSCSLCNNRFGAGPKARPNCSHIFPNPKPTFYIRDGRLVYRRAHSIIGFEVSSVTDPAWRAALSDQVVALEK